MAKDLSATTGTWISKFPLPVTLGNVSVLLVKTPVP
jgi:hypothetical protein